MITGRRGTVARRVAAVLGATLLVVLGTAPAASAAVRGPVLPPPGTTVISPTFDSSAAQLVGARVLTEHGPRTCATCPAAKTLPRSDEYLTQAPEKVDSTWTRSTVIQALGGEGGVVAGHPVATAGTAPATTPTPTASSYHAALTWVLLVLAVGVNVLVWSVVGVVRWVLAHPLRRRQAHPHRCGPRVRPEQVAVLVAAHNEELGVVSTVTAALSLVPAGNVFVVSDGSTDTTVARARTAGATVLDLQPNRGKAGALAVGIAELDLAGRFEVVMLLDADTAPTPDYLLTGLPQFDDPDVVAVAGTAATVWDPTGRFNVVGRCLRAYRERQYVLFQVLIKYGQAAKAVNVLTIVPGFASMYRTRILSEINIAAPGLAIEDFNMTFEVHARHLGRIAFHPGAAVAHTQDPDNFSDYRKQVRRWSLGFWQTVRRHGFHRGRFWFFLAAFVTELLTSSLLFVALGPLVLLVTAAQIWEVAVGTTGTVGVAATEVVSVLPLQTILLGVAVPDVVLTVGVAVLQRRPVYLLAGLTFLPLRCLDAHLCLSALWSIRSTESPGTWASPTRRPPAGVSSHESAGMQTRDLVGAPARRVPEHLGPRSGA